MAAKFKVGDEVEVYGRAGVIAEVSRGGLYSVKCPAPPVVRDGKEVPADHEFDVLGGVEESDITPRGE